MIWHPIKLPTEPITRADSDTTGTCVCGAQPGQPCRSSDCGTWDES